MKHYGDITKISGYDVEPVWIVTGGSPCQDLSVAGRRAGLDGERSGLFMEQIRIIKEMRENDRRKGRTGKFVRPRYMVWENVCGAFSSNNGEDFRIVLEETARVCDPNASIPRPYGTGEDTWTFSGTVMGDGWSIAWRVHDAQFWGVPQRRKRIALVADFGGQTAPEILFERNGLSGNTEPSREERKGTSASAQRCLGKTGITIGGGSITPTLISGQSKQCGNTQDGLTVITGVDLYNQSETGEKTMSITGAATDPHHIPCVALDLFNYKTTGDTANSFTCNANATSTQPTVMAYGFDQGADRDVGRLFLEEQSKAITNGTCPGHHNGVVTYGIDRASFNQGQNAKYDFAVDEELSQTLVAKGPGGVLAKQ